MNRYTYAEDRRYSRRAIRLAWAWVILIWALDIALIGWVWADVLGRVT